MFDKKFLEQQEKKLLKQQTNLQTELSKLRSKKRRGFPFVVRFPRLGSDVDADVQEVEQYEENLSVVKQLSDQLRDTKFALRMLKKGRYGKCLACGEEIQMARLQAYPAALTHANHVRPKMFWQRINVWPFGNKKVNPKKKK